MNEKLNGVAGLLVVILLVGALGATIVTFMSEAEAIPCKCLGSFSHNNRCAGYPP